MKFHMDDSGTWSLGVLIGLPVATLAVALLVGVIVYGARFANRSSWSGWSDRRLLLTWTPALLAMLLIGLTAAYYPWSGEYHQYRNVSGTVASIDSRLLKDAETKFVVRFDGSSMQFGCDDTRCAQVKEGDSLTLSCKRAWQYTGTDGYDCRFVSTEAAA